VTERARLSARIAAIAESATLKVDAKAKALQAEGRPVISYAAGEPDFPTPAHIVEAALVAVPTPYWTTYPEAIKLAGGRQVDVFAGADQGYLVTVEQLEAARTDRTKVLLFVSPSNPTGAVHSAEQVREIGEWALEHGIWIVADEIYQNLTYADDPDGVRPRAVSVVEAVPALADQTILVNGVAKSYAMTGWRLGWMVGPADVIKGAANLQSHLSSNVSNISQRAAIAALTGPQDTVEEMRRAFDRRRRTIVAELSKIDGVTVPVPQGAFYVYPDVSGLLGREWGGVTPASSLELADLMLEQAEVAAVPGEAFGPSGFLRFSYALGDAPLLEGVQRLQRLFA
jgi:aspartate aminotransferase